MSILGPFGFVGGWNTKASAYTLPQDQMSDAQNVQVIYGDLQKRKGSAVLNSSVISGTPAIHGLSDWQINSGNHYLICTAGTKVFEMTNLNGTFSDITGAATITTGANNQHTFSSLNNIIAIFGGVTPDTPLQWNGSGNVASLSGSPPAGNLTTVSNNFMFISGVAANPSRVYWSNVSDPSTWGASNFIDFRASDGDRVTALESLNQNLVIFKRSSIGILFTQQNVVSGTATLAPLTEIVRGIGCVGGQALDHLPDGRIVFLGSDSHVYLFSGSASLEDISDPAPPYSNIQPTLDALPVSQLQYAVVRVYPTRNQVWISVATGTSTTNNTILVYDYKLQAWQSQFLGINANVMAKVMDNRSTPSHPIIIVTGNYGGFVYEQDTGSTNAEGTPIDGYGTISVQVGAARDAFIPRSAIVAYEAQTIGQLQFGYGFNGYTSINQTVILNEVQAGGILDLNFILDMSMLGGPSTLRQVVPLSSNGRVNSIQMQFRNSQDGQDFTVHPIVVSDEVSI